MHQKDLKNKPDIDISKLSPPPEKIRRIKMDSKNGQPDYYNLINCPAQQIFLSNQPTVYSSNLPVYQSPSPPQDMSVNFPMNFLNKKMDTSRHYAENNSDELREAAINNFLPTDFIKLSNSSSHFDPKHHYHIFVGDLAPEIESKVLLDAFSNFGFVTECKIIKDMHTQKPKGYGFVAYATKDEAELAIQMMNGQIIGSRTIRTGWAVRKSITTQPKDQKPLNYSEVINASSESNCTVYVGGITNGLTEEALREAFKEFGEILEVRVFKDKGYSFLRFDTHEGAARAIITMHGRDVVGQPCKCSWGKESSDVTSGSIQSYISSLSKQALMLGQFGILPNVNTLGTSSSGQTFKPNATIPSCPSILAAATATNSVSTTSPKHYPSNNSMTLIQGIQLPGHNGNSQLSTNLCMRSLQHINPPTPFLNAPAKSTTNMILSSTPNSLVYPNQQLCNFFASAHTPHQQSHQGTSQGQLQMPNEMLLTNTHQNIHQTTFSPALSTGHPHAVGSIAMNGANSMNFFPQNELIPIGPAFIPIKSQ